MRENFACEAKYVYLFLYISHINYYLFRQNFAFIIRVDKITINKIYFL